MTVTATLQDSSGNPVSGLGGNTTILFSTCWANFTDLSILNGGTFPLRPIANHFDVSSTTNSWIIFPLLIFHQVKT